MVIIYEAVSNISELMLDSDLAISAAGSTLYEFACLGLPAITVVVADNQRMHSEELHRLGTIINLGYHTDFSDKYILQIIRHLMVDSEKRKEMSENGKNLVDGKGVDRTTKIILDNIE